MNSRIFQGCTGNCTKLQEWIDTLFDFFNSDVYTMNRETCFLIVDRIEEIHERYRLKREKLFYSGATNNQIGNMLLDFAEAEAKEIMALARSSSPSTAIGGTSSIIQAMSKPSKPPEEAEYMLRFNTAGPKAAASGLVDGCLIGGNQDYIAGLTFGDEFAMVQSGYGYSDTAIQGGMGGAGNGMASLIISKGCKNGACESQTGMRMASNSGFW